MELETTYGTSLYHKEQGTTYGTSSYP